MKEIVIHSKVHGTKSVLLDDDDYDLLSGSTWYLYKNKRNFYARRNRPGGVKEYMHRIILGIDDPKLIVDHKDHNGLNNQKGNIRVCTAAQNTYNHRAEHNSTSKFIGVSYSTERKKWCAHIAYNKKNIPLGRYRTEIEAAAARDKAAKKYFGEFANLNLP